MPKYRVSTNINGESEDHQVFDHKIDAESAAAQLALGGFFSTVWMLFPDGTTVYHHDYAPREGVPS